MPEKRNNEYDIQLPFGPPPVLPDVQKQLREYLLCPDRLPIHGYEQAQKYWPREPDPKELYFCDMAPLGTTLKVDRDPTTGKLLQFREVPLDKMGCTAKNSMSLQRAPGPPDQAIRGSNTSFPFWPGGFPQLLTAEPAEDQDSEIDFINNLLTVPPGFEKGIKFKADGRTPRIENDDLPPLVPEPSHHKVDVKEEEASVVNLMSIVKQEEDLLGLWQEETKKDEKKDKEKVAVQNWEVELDDEAGEVIPKEDIIPVLKISEAAPLKKKSKKWAEELDVVKKIEDFEKKIPVMAKTWKFELDTFQKQAILKLEEHANVFVAAHTSAGKTVVAEYAIALSQKRMTKAIYTSPVKALSNQKYRDFKETFGDVGLITGDFQINQTAQCLIMTTEILRSMLYCGSEVIRDLEFVIFDEVHYINDSERGHVWEEVLILLPDHVRIVMLSATVPNTLEFANWVGATKKKKVYVVSTLYRPVPLEHFLYTGSGGKSKDERFLIVSKEKFILENYKKAVSAKTVRQSQQKASFGPKQGKQILSPKEEKTLWEGFIDHLKREDKLPVVAFTLSRNRCDQNSQNLSSVDLTTKEEKSQIHMFFKHSIQNLKQDDRMLPQVVKLEGHLKRGIGVHHSGILPILKEIVEMLFQKGLVKLLFATETFAMGVNMPARTVVFDSIIKFDGHGRRVLQPAEYIQMAGRAGRRGLDSTGTVIIMCKGDVPKEYELQNMMLGKPTTLESKFRLTYSMLLNLFRVEQISIKRMMGCSFKEFERKISQEKCGIELKAVEEKINTFSDNLKNSPNWKPLSEFYDLAKEYFDIWAYVRSDMLTHPKYVKELVPGKIILVSFKEHVNKLGILLAEDTSKKEKAFKVLVLCDSEFQAHGGTDDEIKLSLASPQTEKVKKEDEMDPLWYKMLGMTSRKKIFVPDGVGGHTVLRISACDIIEVVVGRHSVKLDTTLVMSDWEKRQQLRFRNDPPAPTCSDAVKKLRELTENVASGTIRLEFVSPLKDIQIKKHDILDCLSRLGVLRKKLHNCTIVNIPGFEEQFIDVFRHKKLEEEKEDLIYKQSYKSLSLYPEFQIREEVLRTLKYINSNNIPELKGKVACEMGNNELMITEMLFQNILQDKQPEEIAALLSCLVFQQRTTEQPELTESLKQGKKEIENIAEQVKQVEKSVMEKLQIFEQEAFDEYEKLNFGLMQVVYEWARGKPFSEIMALTDVQEGIIVRCIQQLNETLRDVRNAANLIGYPVLKQKMQEASDAIKRDIVFAASLYTSEEHRQMKQSMDETLLPVGDE